MNIRIGLPILMPNWNTRSGRPTKTLNHLYRKKIMIIEDTGTSFTPVPAGMHLARCYRIIDVGTQKVEFEGNVKMQRKLKIVWEVHGNDEDGNPLVTEKNEPMIVDKDYTFSWADKANLRLDLQSWRGKPFSDEEQRRFDLKNLLDKWCMVNVTHKAKKKGNGVYANVSAVTPVPSALKASLPKGHNQCRVFQISDPDMELFNSFSDYLKKKIEGSPEWQARDHMSTKTSDKSSGFDDMEDDIPF